MIRNSLRVAHVWMDEYIEYYFQVQVLFIIAVIRGDIGETSRVGEWNCFKCLFYGGRGIVEIILSDFVNGSEMSFFKIL